MEDVRAILGLCLIAGEKHLSIRRKHIQSCKWRTESQGRVVHLALSWKCLIIFKNHAFAYAVPTIWNDLCHLSLYFISKSKCNYGTISNVTCFVKNSVISLIKYDYFQLCIWLIPLEYFSFTLFYRYWWTSLSTRCH